MWVKSTDGGLNFKFVFHPSFYNNIPTSFLAPFAMSQIDHNILYVGCNDIYKSTDGGETPWTKITNYGGDKLFEIIAIAPSSDQYIYAKMDRSDVVRTKDGGTIWENIDTPSGYYITDIEISSDNPEQIYISCMNNLATKVLTSNDAGDNFTEIEKDLPNIGIHTIILENNVERGIYAGMSTGVFYTNDNLENWIEYSENLPHVRVEELEIVKSASKLRAATFGRGIWKTDLYAEDVSIKESKLYQSLELYPNPAKEHLELSFSKEEFTHFIVFNAAGYKMQQIDIANHMERTNIELSKYVQGVYFVKAYTKSGKSIVKKFVKM